ncbi:MAG: MurR/RpiR family transcriptional regulator [Gemmobacter sp.]
MKREAEEGPSLGYARPETFEELLAVIASDGDRLPKRLRAVAIHVTQNPDDVALATVTSLAEAMGSTPSTLVRFAKTFGYAGFSDLQAVFKAHLRAGLGMPAGGGEGGAHALTPFLRAAEASLCALDAGFDGAAFDAIAGAVAAAPVLHLIGSKRAFPVVSYLSLTLLQHGFRTVMIDNLGSQASDQVNVLGPGDVVLAVSFSPYNSPTPALAAMARARGARVLALTDSGLSPLVAVAEPCLIVAEKSAGGYRTLAATMVTALGLAVAAAERRGALRRRG